MILVDTNIPLRMAQLGHPHRDPALAAIRLLSLRDSEEFCIAPQSLYEMYVVCTRPIAVNGLGMESAAALAEISGLRGIFQVLGETPQTFPIWESLVAKYPIRGKQAHDARLVAVMIEQRVPRLLTYNDADFRFYTEIEVLNPFDVLQVPRT